MGFESFTPRSGAESTDPVLPDGVHSSEFHSADHPDDHYNFSDQTITGESVGDAAILETHQLPFDDREVLEAYEVHKFALAEQLASWEAELNTIHSDTFDPHSHNIDDLLAQRELLLQENVHASANYPGNWTLLLRERMLDPVTKDKFITQRTTALSAMKTGEPGPLDRLYEFQQHYQNQIDNYEARLDDIFAITQIGTAAQYGKRPQHLGQGATNEPGAVFLDAINKTGEPLNVRQKNIIEAHEKGHGLRDFQSPQDRREVRAVLDDEMLDTLLQEKREQESSGQVSGRFSSIYLEKPEEIIERMAQFKNYFGMTAEETFTKQHLDHIREHYVVDTGLDNGVTDLLRCVTPQTEAMFLSVINKYPI